MEIANLDIVLPLAISFLHVPADRVSCGRLPGQGGGARLFQLCAVRLVLPAIDFGPDRPSQRDDAAICEPGTPLDEPGSYSAGARLSRDGALQKRSSLRMGIAPIADQVFDASNHRRASDVRRLDRYTRLYVSDLFRLFRLLGYGCGHRLTVRHPASPEFQLTVSRRQHHRFLAPLAHHVVPVYRDYIYIPLGGNRKKRGQKIYQRTDRNAHRRTVARCRLDIHRLGCTARGLPHREPPVSGGFMQARRNRPSGPSGRGRILTLLAVMIAWVFFPVGRFSSASRMLQGMFSAW